MRKQLWIHVGNINRTLIIDYFILFILHRQLLRTGIQFQIYFYTRFDYIAMQLDIITRTSAFCIKHRFLQANSSSFSNLLLCRISLSRTSIYIVFIYSYYCYKEKLSNMLNHHCKNIWTKLFYKKDTLTFVDLSITFKIRMKNP